MAQDFETVCELKGLALRRASGKLRSIKSARYLAHSNTFSENDLLDCPAEPSHPAFSTNIRPACAANRDWLEVATVILCKSRAVRGQYPSTIHLTKRKPQIYSIFAYFVDF